MKKQNPLRRFRLIPSVLVLGTALLVIKGAGLALDARAQDQPAASSSASTAAATNDPAADNADDSSAQVDVLTSLAKRRAELDARERDLSMRENLIAAAEKRVDVKIDDLKHLQVEIEGLLAQRDDAEQKQLAALVKTYSNMPPKDAARIFDNLDEAVLLAVAQQMKPADLAGVLAKMQSEPAQKLTVKLAERMKIRDIPTQALFPPAQIASTAPVRVAAPPPSGPAPSTAAAPETAPQAPASAPPQDAKSETPQAAGK